MNSAQFRKGIKDLQNHPQSFWSRLKKLSDGEQESIMGLINNREEEMRIQGYELLDVLTDYEKDTYRELKYLESQILSHISSNIPGFEYLPPEYQKPFMNIFVSNYIELHTEVIEKICIRSGISIETAEDYPENAPPKCFQLHGIDDEFHSMQEIPGAEDVSSGFRYFQEELTNKAMYMQSSSKAMAKAVAKGSYSAAQNIVGWQLIKFIRSNHPTVDQENI